MTLKDKIQTALDKGLVEGAKRNLRLLMEQEHKAEWTKAKQEEYDALYPMYRDMTADEMAEYDTQFTEENPKPISYDDEGNEIEFVYPQVEIDYSEDKNYVTFQEWLNETRVVTEAVEEVFHTETIDGIETKVIDVEYVPEVTETVRPYVATESTDDMVLTRLEDFGYNYAYLRANAYPPIKEQLDMLYKDSLDGTTTWKDTINEIKTKYPKS